MKRLSLLVALLMAAGPASAVLNNYDFTGAVSADWNDPNNWVTLSSIGSPRSSGSTAVLPPGAADQVVVRDGVTVTVYGGYTASMGTSGNTNNGIGAAAYLDPNDPNVRLWAEPAKLVMADETSKLAQGVGKVSGRYVIGGVYGGELVMNGGSLVPDHWLMIGEGGDYAYGDHATATNVGRLIMNGGTLVPEFDGTNGTKTRMRVGYAGGNGTLIINNGVLPRSASSSKWGLSLYVGEGTAGNTTNGNTWGYMEFNGGSLNADENFWFGSNSGKAKLLITGGSFLSGGDNGFGMGNNHNDPNYADAESLSYGEATVSGNAAVVHDRLALGWQNGLGTLTIKDTASWRYTMVNGGLANENSIGRSCVYGANSLLSGNGVGVVNVEGGTFQFLPATNNTSRGTIRLGWTWDNKTNATKDPNLVLETVFSRGEINQTGGVVLIEAGGTVADSEQYLVLGSSWNNQAKNHATGIVNVTGGSFLTVGTATPVLEDPNDPNSPVIGYVRAPVHVILAQNKDTTGIFKIGRNAYVNVDGKFIMGAGGTLGLDTGAVAKLAVEFDATKNGKLNLTNVATLGGTLEVNTTGYRPRQGDKMDVIRSTDPNDVGFSGDFAVITSNITLGLQGGPAFTGAIVSGGSKEYEVTFAGLTAGDCAVNSAVDGGDLSIIGGTWGLGGQDWLGADFTGEGNVDGGDLALMGGNWNWALPGAPGAPLPEPATLALLGLGGLAMIRRKR